MTFRHTPAGQDEAGADTGAARDSFPGTGIGCGSIGPPRRCRGIRAVIGRSTYLRAEAAVASRQNEREDRHLPRLLVYGEAETLRQQRADHQLAP